MSFERDQVISFLLQQCDTKNAQIAGLQKSLAELEKKLADSAPKEPAKLEAV